MKLGLQDNWGLTDAQTVANQTVGNGPIKHHSIGLHIGLNLRLSEPEN
jgi:hypothetical protein